MTDALILATPAALMSVLQRPIAGLGELLRHAVAHGIGTATVPEELDFLERYGDIQRPRFGDHLAIELAVADECQGALLPSVILHPLVENAIL